MHFYSHRVTDFGLIGLARVQWLCGNPDQALQTARQVCGVNTLTGEGLSHAIAGSRVVIDVTNSPTLDGMIEHAGPEIFHLDQIMRHIMIAAGDQRAVIADSRARYFGAELSNDSLTPDEGAIVGVTRFDEWLKEHASILRAEGGIGLNVVKRTVELHRGTVQAFSAGPDLGSTFTVRLPRHP